jgi:hypothetical protein
MSHENGYERVTNCTNDNHKAAARDRATTNTGSSTPTPSLLPVLPHAGCTVVALHHPSLGTQYAHRGIRRWLDTDGNVPARGMPCIPMAS